VRYVIIGNCIAAAGAVEGIRSYDQKGEITIIDGERRGCYSRPLISYLLAGSKGAAGLHYRSEAFFARNQARVIPARAVRIDPPAGQLELDDGMMIDYDRLLLATGASPLIPELPGIEHPRVKTLYTWKDAEEIAALVETGATAVILGSGLIGLKAAEALHQRGMKVVIVEKQEQILPRLLSPWSATIALRHLQEQGIQVLTGHQAVSISESGEVELDHGAKIPAQLVIVAVGNRPNQSLAREAGLKTGKGIIVNQYLQTSDPDIWAAGDVIETHNILSGAAEVMALLPLAHLEGYLAGCNMAGQAVRYPGAIFLNAVHFMGMHIIAAGEPNRSGTVLQWQQGSSSLEMTIDGDYLLRYIAINLPGITGPLTAIVEQQIRIELKEWQEFIREPSMASLPAAYWAEMRRWEEHGGLRCG
jgi:NADPH-dependent 2,4-dienoyl-CoA reductase/sulfur reductase-like enzyme